MAADVREVSKLWEFTVHMKYILHGMMMKSIYQNVMAVILIAGHMNIANTTKKNEYFFQSVSNTFLYFFIN